MADVASRSAHLCAMLLIASFIVGRVAAEEAPPAAVAPAPLAWLDLSDALALASSGGSVGVVATVPGSDLVIVGVNEHGLLQSGDGGRRWTRLGSDTPALATAQPHQIVFDPTDAKKFWISNRAGAGLFATSDGGVTVARLGNLEGVCGFGIDFTDPKRKCMLACHYDKERSVEKSANSGSIWTRIGSKLPDKLHPTNHVVVLDAKTFLVATTVVDPLLNKKGGKEKESAIFRSEDGGTTWVHVASQGSLEPALVTATGAIYWSFGFGEGLLRSIDHGKIWTQLDAPARSSPIELPKGWIAALGDRQVVVSTDGKIWEKVGPPLSFLPGGLVFSQARHCFYAWRAAETPGKEMLMRLDLPEQLELAITPVAPRDVVVWNGDDVAKGAGWMAPKTPPMAIDAQSHEQIRQGKTALKLHGEGGNWAGFGWNWFGWFPANAGSDVSGMRNLVFALRIDGAARPEVVKVRLDCSSNKKPTAEVDIAPYCAAWADGKWHDVVVPLAELMKGSEFDPKTAWEIALVVSAKGALNCDLYVDDIGFNNRTP